MERAKFTIVIFPNREGCIKDAAKQKSDQILQKGLFLQNIRMILPTYIDKLCMKYR